MPATTPEECDALFAKHLNAGNIDGVVALYEPDALLVMDIAAPARGLAAIRESLMQFVGMRPTLTMNVRHVLRTGDDLAVLYNDWTLTGTGPDGAAIADSGKAIEIVRRQSNGTWLFVVDDPRARG